MLSIMFFSSSISRPLLILTQPRDSDGEDLLVTLRHFRHHDLHPARRPVDGHVDCVAENVLCESTSRCARARDVSQEIEGRQATAELMA